MSFHKCGTNVGDVCYIPLPSWVVQVGNSNPDIWYRDTQNGIDDEYLSLGVDNQRLFGGRTPIEIYSDFMASFLANFASLMPNVINQIQIGLGPAGEMRYPGYQLQDNKWRYCGIGEFQCYDKYMLASLQQAAANAGHSEWGHPPNNAGNYNSNPGDTQFFSDNGGDNYASDYGKFFLDWYSNVLKAHGSAILSKARSIFPSSVEVAAKISGIHWWYRTSSHAAEATSGYYNTNFNNAYLGVAQMLAQFGADFDFTCLEMVDDSNCGSAPEGLVVQTQQAAKQAGIKFAGENALELCNPNCYQGGFDRVYTAATQNGPIALFTYLRLTQNLLYNGNNWNMFTQFVARMHNAK